MKFSRVTRGTLSMMRLRLEVWFGFRMSCGDDDDGWWLVCVCVCGERLLIRRRERRRKKKYNETEIIHQFILIIVYIRMEMYAIFIFSSFLALFSLFSTV